MLPFITWRIGRHCASGVVNLLNGKMDDIRIYDGALTDAQIASYTMASM